MNSPRIISLKKHFIYNISLIILYVFQTTPFFLEINGVKPLFLFPAAIAIAMFEGELTGGIYGIICGILCDTAGFIAFGFNTILLLSACVLISFLIENLLQPGFITHLLYSFLTTIIILSLQFLFIYGIWRISSLTNLYIDKVFFVSIYTGIISPFIYFFFKKINKHFKRLSR